MANNEGLKLPYWIDDFLDISSETTNQQKKIDRENFIRKAFGRVIGRVFGWEIAKPITERIAPHIETLLDQPNLMNPEQSKPLVELIQKEFAPAMERMVAAEKEANEFLRQNDNENALPLLYEAFIIARGQRAMLQGLRTSMADRADEDTNNLAFTAYAFEWHGWNNLREAGFTIPSELKPPIFLMGKRDSLS